MEFNVCARCGELIKGEHILSDHYDDYICGSCDLVDTHAMSVQGFEYEEDCYYLDEDDYHNYWI